MFLFSSVVLAFWALGTAFEPEGHLFRFCTKAVGIAMKAAPRLWLPRAAHHPNDIKSPKLQTPEVLPLVLLFVNFLQLFYVIHSRSLSPLC